MPWPIHTVVLDLDDTLFAEAEFVLGGFRAAGQWLQVERGINGFFTASASLFERGLRGTIFDEALRALHVTPEPALIQGLVRAYREHAPHLSLLPDAARFLRDATAWRLALLSDGYLDVQRRKFESLKVAPRFSCVVFTDAFGRGAWKPSPVGFRHIMQDLRGAPEGFVYVADNPRKDFIAPRALGWRTVRIRRASGEHVTYEPAPHEAAHCEIRSLDELPALIEPCAVSIAK